MSRIYLFVTIAAIVIMISTSAAVAAIDVRLGLALPQGDVKNLAGTGWLVDLSANVKSLPLKSASIIVGLSSTSFGKKSADYYLLSGEAVYHYTQSSQISYAAAGVGLRVEPPTIIFKPFVEVLAKFATVQQDYSSGQGGSSLDTKTVYGYQINGGIKYAFIPRVSLVFGASYISLSKATFKNIQHDYEARPQTLGIFTGVSLGIGL